MSAKLIKSALHMYFFYKIFILHCFLNYFFCFMAPVFFFVFKTQSFEIFCFVGARTLKSS